MTVNESYLYIIEILNKLGTNFSDNLPKHSFVRHFNSAQYQWVEDRVKLSETNRVRIDELQPIMLTLELIPKSISNYWEIDLPVDYYHYVRSYSVSGDCNLFNWEVREGDMNVVMQDEFWKPSLEWEQAPCTIIGGQLRVYADFPINKVFFTYHRYPREINMKDNYLDVNDNLTVDIDPEFKGSSLIEILNLTARNIAGMTGDQLQYQVNQNRSTQHT